MNQKKLVGGIIKRLSEGNAPDDVILETAQKLGSSWSEAEELVKDVQEKDVRQITQKQMPLLLAVALTIFAAGLVLTGYGVYAIVASLAAGPGDLGPRDITSYLLPVIVKGVDPAAALQPAVLPYFDFILGLVVSPISALVFGVAMMLGSLLGMRDAWEILLDRR